MIRNVFLLALMIYVSQGIRIKKPSTCHFPFTYKGQLYEECTNVDSKSYWCSTTKLYNGTMSLCQVEDIITDDDFMKLIKQSEAHVARLNDLKVTISGNEDKCTGCSLLLKTISQNVVEQTAIFMDQNKRLQGLSVQHQQLENVVKQLKKFYQMRRCRQTNQGADYLGVVHTTGSGVECQKWSSSKFNDDSSFADGNVKVASNFCRNPDVNSNPWCYTNLEDNSWDNCHIPKCDVDCKIDEASTSGLPLCDRFASAKCPAGSVYYENNCYTKHTETVDYATALKICLDNKSQLVSIHSDSENVFVATKVFTGKEPFYIGLNDRVKENNFVWTDGTAFDYKHFFTGEPNSDFEDCVELGRFPSQREAWNDIDCSRKQGFVCKFPISQS